MAKHEKIKRLHELTEQFKALEKSGALDLSTEATARTWIDDLLRVFDWNPKDPNEVDQEITLSDAEAEKLSKIDSSHTRPDYLLCAKSRSLVFIDAKKIGLSIEDHKKTAFQIRCYGWSAKHYYAVVTNFKEMAIYDCRFKPNKDQSADVARVFYCTYETYIDNFNIISEHLDKNEIMSGLSFDKYKSTDKPIGTKTLDEDFSEKISEWRLKIANSIYSYNKSLSIEHIAEATQSVIDRIVFSRVAEGLNVLEKEFLNECVQGKNPWKTLNEFIGDECNKRFGGMLFNVGMAYKKVNIDDSLIKEFVESLYYPNPYRFDVISPALLGNIYERYLGRKLEFKGSKVVDDFKEEYQKTKGAVYTPEFIVHSVCIKTIAPLLNNSSFEKIMGLKILDPSSGSGSFLLGVFDCLHDELIKLHDTSRIKGKQLGLFWSNPRTGKTLLRTFAKRELINSCIHGVDIDPQAVEVSRLSLSLKALESGSLEPIALRELGLLDSQLIDGIGDNIKLGNSLVDSRVFPYLNSLSPKDKKDLNIEKGIAGNIEALKKLKAFDWDSEAGFEKVMSDGGFDAIVGNPPYIEIKHYKKNSPLMHKYLSK